MRSPHGTPGEATIHPFLEAEPTKWSRLGLRKGIGKRRE
jgi:hypothetical protein